MSACGEAKGAAFLECAIGGRALWVRVDFSIVAASLTAIISAVNRAQHDQVGRAGARRPERAITAGGSLHRLTSGPWLPTIVQFA